MRAIELDEKDQEILEQCETARKALFDLADPSFTSLCCKGQEEATS